MVPRLCVMTINCVLSVSLWRYWAKRPTLLSSSAASISSRRQKGEGLRLWMANRSAMAVSAFSPPESCIIFCSFLPGGWAITRTPASRMSTSSMSSSLPPPPPNSSLKTASYAFWISANCSRNCLRMASSSSATIVSRDAAASVRSSCCPLRKV